MSKRKIESKGECPTPRRFSTGSNIKRGIQSRAKSSSNFKTSLFGEKSKDVQVNSSTKNFFYKTSSERWNNEDLRRKNVSYDRIRFITDDEDETTPKASTSNSQMLDWGESYAKQFKNVTFPVSSKSVYHSEPKVAKVREKSSNSRRRVAKKIGSAFEDSFSRSEDQDECRLEKKKAAIISNKFQVDSPNFHDYFADDESASKDEAIDRGKRNGSNFTPKCVKVTDSINFIPDFEGENENDRSVGSSRKLRENEESKTSSKHENPRHSSAVKKKYASGVARVKRKPRIFTPKCVKVTDTIKFISDSEGENGNVSTVNLSKKFSENEVSNSFTPKCVKMTDTIKFISDSEGENDNVSTVNLSSKKFSANEAWKSFWSPLKSEIPFISESKNEEAKANYKQGDFEISNSSKKEKKNSDLSSADVSRLSDINKKVLKVVLEKLDISEYYGKKKKSSAKKTLKAKKVVGEDNFTPNSKNKVDESVAECSLEKSSPGIVSGDEINFITDSENEDNLNRRSKCVKKSNYVWDYTLSPCKLAFSQMKIAESEEDQLSQLNDEANKTDQEKRFLKILGTKKLPSFFLGSVNECTFSSSSFSLMDPLNGFLQQFSGLSLK